MIMENQEMVMEKLWTNILSSLWEPCYFTHCRSYLLNLCETRGGGAKHFVFENAVCLDVSDNATYESVS